MISIIEPLPYQVIQRINYEPITATHNSSDMGFGVIKVKFLVQKSDTFDVFTRVELLNGEDCKLVKDWQPLIVSCHKGIYIGEITIRSGGWYRLGLLVKFLDDE